jgi:hypothetical protein
MNKRQVGTTFIDGVQLGEQLERFSVKSARNPAKIQPASQAERQIFPLFPPCLIKITVKDSAAGPLPSIFYLPTQLSLPESASGVFWAAVFPCVRPAEIVLHPSSHVFGQNDNTLSTTQDAPSARE